VFSSQQQELFIQGEVAKQANKYALAKNMCQLSIQSIVCSSGICDINRRPID